MPVPLSSVLGRDQKSLKPFASPRPYLLCELGLDRPIELPKPAWYRIGMDRTSELLGWIAQRCGLLIFYRQGSSISVRVGKNHALGAAEPLIDMGPVPLK